MKREANMNSRNMCVLESVKAATLFVLLLSLIAFSSIPAPSLSQELPSTPVPSTPELRGLKDTVGFAVSAPQMNLAVELSRKAETEMLAENAEKFGLKEGPFYIAGVSPHDDYIYAGPVYIHLYPYIKAKRVVIFGVSHYARRHGVENVLIFDSFKRWRGPYGEVKVSGLREEILKALPESDYMVSSSMQAEEHSVEAIVPWLQYFNRDVEIVSIMAPYMRWSRLDSLSGDLAEALAGIIKKHNWKLGQDIAFIMSNDCSHYGDQGWGGKNYAPFGSDCAGLEKATARDVKIARETLCGELTSEKIHKFFTTVIDPEDYHMYRVTWCGRFAVPFGANTLVHLMEKLGRPPLKGDLLRYGDSVELGELDVRKVGLGVTAPANLHHWVGYVSIGYR